jgi:hypothetical protein
LVRVGLLLLILDTHIHTSTVLTLLPLFFTIIIPLFIGAPV